MAELFTIENLFTLVVLTALETVLGFDNLLYISIEAKRVAPAQAEICSAHGHDPGHRAAHRFAVCRPTIDQPVSLRPFFSIPVGGLRGRLQRAQPDRAWRAGHS